jgi:hypothetical protein
MRHLHCHHREGHPDRDCGIGDKLLGHDKVTMVNSISPDQTIYRTSRRQPEGEVGVEGRDPATPHFNRLMQRRQIG